MARIRDVSFGVGASSASFTMPNPVLEELDLIVAFATRDTGTGVLVAPATWYQVMEVGTANNRAVGAIKLAITGEANPIFTTATADTWCGTMASVISANIGTPAAFQTLTDVDGATEVVTTDAAHGFTTADPVWYMKRGGTNAIGLTNGSLYYIRALTTTTLAFYTTAANASADTSRIDLTAAGSDETHYIYKCASAVDVSVTDVTGSAAFDDTCPTATTVASNVLVFRFTGRDVTTTAYPGLANYPNEMYLDNNDSGITGGPATASAWTVKAAAGGATGTFSFHGTTSNVACRWTFGVKPASGAPVPAYVDPAGSNGLILHPLHLITSTAFSTTMEDMVTVATTITSFGGRSITADALANAADFGLNPFANAMSGTPAVSANWQGYRLNRGSGIDLSSGAVLGTFMNANPRDHSFDQGKLDEGGVGIILQDTDGDWRGWQIAALNATPTTLGRYVWGVDSDDTASIYAENLTFNSAAVQKFCFLYTAPRTATVNYWSYLVQTQTLKMVGGSASLPADITDLDKIGNHFLFPMIVRQGTSAVLSLTPIQLGGSVASYINLNATTIQFPRISSVTLKQVFWHGIGNGTTNTLALRYKLLAGDTVKHTNSIVSSPSKYTWEIDAASSASATYDFQGLTIIGADPVTFINVTTFSGISMSDCGTIATASCTLNNCTISGVPATNDTLTTNGSTLIKNSTITVTGVTAGNRWCSVASPVIFENNSFTGSSTTGHAMRITSTAGSPFSFVGNTFTSFGADGTTSAAIYNDSGGAITINVSGGGNTPTIRNGAGASTTVNNTVTLKVTVVDKNTNPIPTAQVAIFKTSDNTPLMNQDTVTVTTGSFVVGVKYIIVNVGDTDFTAIGAASNTVGVVFTATGVGGGTTGTASNGIASVSNFNYISDTAIYIRIRKSSADGTKYIPASTTGTITSTGFSATITLEVDPNA